MDVAVVIAGVAAVAVLGILLFFVLRTASTKKPEVAVANEPEPADGGGEQAARQAAPGGVRQRGRNAMDRLTRRAVAPTEAIAAPVAGVLEDNDDDNEEIDGMPKKIGAKKAEKLRQKEEQRRQRELMLAQREDTKRRDALKDEERKKQREEEERIEKAEEEKEKKRLEEIRQQEEEEYRRLRQDIVVEQEGTDQQSVSEMQNLLARIAEYVREYKVVTLEELASEFRIRTQDAILRLKELDSTGAITGVLDDRGKYIYISAEEMQQVAAFVQKRGRISRSELASMSNKLINLKGNRRKANADGVFDFIDQEPAAVVTAQS